MGNGCQHLGAFADEVLDLRLHGVEGDSGLAYFVGAFDVDGRCAQIATEASGSAGETLQRLGQLPGGDPSDQQGSDQPQDDDHRNPRGCAQAPTAFGRDERQPAAIK